MDDYPPSHAEGISAAQSDRRFFASLADEEGRNSSTGNSNATESQCRWRSLMQILVPFCLKPQTSSQLTPVSYQRYSPWQVRPGRFSLGESNPRAVSQSEDP